MEAFEIIRAAMTEFAEVEDDTVKVFISLAEPLISRKRFGKLYQQALAYLSAHRMKMSGLGKGIGPGTATIGDTIGLSSASEGGTSVSFSNSQSGNTDTDSEYGLTVYGMQYLQLRKRCVVTIISAGVEHGC